MNSGCACFSFELNGLCLGRRGYRPSNAPFQQQPPAPKATSPIGGSTPAAPASPAAATVVDPNCLAYAIPTTGHRPELSRLLDELVIGTGVRGSRVHLFIDMTALKPTTSCSASCRSHTACTYHRSRQTQDAQQRDRPARPWPKPNHAPSPSIDRNDGHAARGVDVSMSVSLWYHCHSYMLDTMLKAGAPRCRRVKPDRVPSSVKTASPDGQRRQGCFI